jgi:hypothetical protein
MPDVSFHFAREAIYVLNDDRADTIVFDLFASRRLAFLNANALRPAGAEMDLLGSRVLIDVFFLRVVEAYKGLYRLDDALRVAN